MLPRGRVSNCHPKVKEEDSWILVNPLYILGVLGSSLCLSSMYSFLFSRSFFEMNVWMDGILVKPYLIFILSLTAAYIIIAFFSSFFQRHRGILVAGAILGFGAIVVMSITSLVSLVPICAALVGIGISFGSMLWLVFFCVQMRSFTRQGLSFSFILGFFWVLIDFTCSLHVEIAGLFLFLSLLLYLALRVYYDAMKEWSNVSAEESDSRLQIKWKSYLLTVTAGVARGFALALLFHSGFEADELLAVGVILISLVQFLDKKNYLNEPIIRRLFLPVLLGCFLSMLFLPGETWGWLCLIALIFSFLPCSNALFATCEHVSLFELSPLRVFSRTQALSHSGLLIGFIIGWLSYAVTISPLSINVCIVAVVMLFVVVWGIAGSENNYPNSKSTSAKTVRLNPSTGKVEMVEEILADNLETEPFARFRDRCDVVAAYYGLTERQKEVFHYLARGRNASYIEKALVISQHTVKAHIYEIYRKLDIHSQQELIDLIENFSGE